LIPIALIQNFVLFVSFVVNHSSPALQAICVDLPTKKGPAVKLALKVLNKF
jgi:hypothetical protein